MAKLVISTLIVIFGSFSLAAAAIAADPPSDSISPHDFLQLLGIDQKRLAAFRDGEPFSEDELNAVRQLLARSQNFPSEKVQEWQRAVWSGEAANESASPRGQFYRLRGRVTAAEKISVPTDVADRLRMGEFWRLSVEAEADGRSHLQLLVRAIPKSWQRAAEVGVPIDQNVEAAGLFLKTVPHEETGRREPVFFVPRLRWTPAEPNPALGIAREHVWLAAQGFDLNWLDGVRDRSKLGSSDREGFYQLLSLVHNHGPHEFSEKARRDTSVVQLLQKPEDHRGKFYHLIGTARRAIRVDVEDADVRQRLKIDHYYELEVFLQTDATIRVASQPGEEGKVFNTYPIVFLTTDLPTDFPQGELIHENVELDGVYFKMWAYKTKFMSGGDSVVAAQAARDGETPQPPLQISPLLIGPTPKWLRSDSAPAGSLPWWAVAVVALIVAAGFYASYRVPKASRIRSKSHEPPPSFDELD